MKRPYTHRQHQQQRDPNWQRPAADSSRCGKSPDGKHRWITTFLRGDQVETLRFPTCDVCLEIDDRTEYAQ